MREATRSQAPVDPNRDELALCFRTLGWMLLAFDWIIVVFVPIGWRAGSFFWTWWFGVEAVIGLSLVIAGNLMGEAEELPHAAHEPQQHRERVVAVAQKVATAS